MYYILNHLAPVLCLFWRLGTETRVQAFCRWHVMRNVCLGECRDCFVLLNRSFDTGWSHFSLFRRVLRSVTFLDRYFITSCKLHCRMDRYNNLQSTQVCPFFYTPFDHKECRFSVRSFHFIGLFSFGYTTWISIIKYKTGAYPYGFLNTMPEPLGLVLMVPIAATTMSVFFLIGKRLSKLTKNIGDFEQVEALDQFTPTDVKAP